MVGLPQLEERFPYLRQYMSDEGALARWRLSIISAWVICGTLSLFENFEDDIADPAKDKIIEDYRKDFGDISLCHSGLLYVGELLSKGSTDQWAYGLWVFTQLTGQDASDNDRDLVESLGTLVIAVGDEWWNK